MFGVCGLCLCEFQKFDEDLKAIDELWKPDTDPAWYDQEVKKVFLAFYRFRLIGYCPDEMLQRMKDLATINRDKFDLLWDAYQMDLLDFSTTKARTSTAIENEVTPDTPVPTVIENAPTNPGMTNPDSKLSIKNPLTANRYLSQRQIQVVDYAGSSGLSTNTNLDDINHFRDRLSGFIIDFVKIFDPLFVKRW